MPPAGPFSIEIDRFTLPLPFSLLISLQLVPHLSARHLMLARLERSEEKNLSKNNPPPPARPPARPAAPTTPKADRAEIFVAGVNETGLLAGGHESAKESFGPVAEFLKRKLFKPW